MGGGGRAVDLGARARGDDDRARRRRHRALLPARAPAGVGRRFRRDVRGGGRGADRRGGVRRVRPDGEFEGMLPVRRLRGDWWELNEQGTILVGTRSGGAIRLGDPVQVRVGRIDAPRGRVDLLPAPGRIERSMAKRRKRKAASGRRRDQPPGVLPLQPARALRVRDRADRHRGQVAARGQGPAEGRLRRDPRRRGVADRRSTSRRTGRPRGRTTTPSGRASCCCTATRSSG